MSAVGCKNCWHGVDLKEGIVCRRNPPAIDPSPLIATDGDRRPGVWPIVDGDDLCGEYKRNPNKLPDAKAPSWY